MRELMTRFRILCTHEILNVSKNGRQTNKHFLTKLIPELLMIVVSINKSALNMNSFVPWVTKGWNSLPIALRIERDCV